MSSAYPRRQRRHAGPQPAGFTLIEVMVAGTFFLVSFAGMVSGIAFCTHQYEHQRKMTAAIAVAESVMEELLLYQQSDTRLDTGQTTTKYYDINGNKVAQAADAAFTGTWSVEGNAPIAGLRKITLTISWEESVATRSLVLESTRL